MPAIVEEVPHWQAWCAACRWYGPMRVEHHDAESDRRGHHDNCPQLPAENQNGHTGGDS